eukprot:COSAG06_NODE_1061_length_10874_cov_7.752390_11_plen_74_part_00
MLCCPSLYSTYHTACHTAHAVATRGKVHLPVAVQPVSTANSNHIEEYTGVWRPHPPTDRVTPATHAAHLEAIA